MKTHILRLRPGEDIKTSIEDSCKEQEMMAGVINTCVGSLKSAVLRLASGVSTSNLLGPFEIVSLVGTYSPDGVHLHICLADQDGKTIGGHLQKGSIILTTAEIAIGVPEGVSFQRKFDIATGYQELVIKK